VSALGPCLDCALHAIECTSSKASCHLVTMLNAGWFLLSRRRFRRGPRAMCWQMKSPSTRFVHGERRGRRRYSCSAALWEATSCPGRRRVAPLKSDDPASSSFLCCESSAEGPPQRQRAREQHAGPDPIIRAAHNLLRGGSEHVTLDLALGRWRGYKAYHDHRDRRQAPHQD
jgi:hypothetical protein